jgi:hypothetical protein
MTEKEMLEQVSAQIRLEYMELIKSIDTSSLSVDSKDCVTLYHGTTTAYLNSIIRNGILPRNQTGIGNWDEEVASVENVTYLTNKWHYSYAIHAHIRYLQKEHGEDFGALTKERTSFPCYVECKVPKDLLVVDEDYFLTSHFLQKLKSQLKKNPDMPYMELPNLFDPMECLSQYATVGVLGNIPPSMIVSFTVLGDENMYRYITEPSSPYVKDWNKWSEGKGKGKLKLITMHEKEAESDLNGTWFIPQVKKNTIIQFGLNEASGKLAMVQR